MRSTPGPRRDREHEGAADDVRVDLGWEDIRRELAARWPRLNERDLEALAAESDALSVGNYQLLVGRLRERYGLEQTAAEEEVRKFVRALDPSVRSTPLRQHSTPTLGHGRPLSDKS